MKCFVTCCFVVALLQFVAAQNNGEQPITEYPFEYNVEDRSILWGTIDSGDILITEDETINPTDKETVTQSAFEGEPGFIITAIKAFPSEENSNDVLAKIIEGGIGQNRAVVQLALPKGEGSFIIDFYGRFEEQ